MTYTPRNYSRRDLLKLSGTALTTTALAGCTNNEPKSESGTGGDIGTSITTDDNTYNGTVIGDVENHIPDIALIEINNDVFDAPAFSLGDDTTLDRDDTLVQVGHPRNQKSWTSAIGHYQKHNTAAGWFESTLPTESGNSGSRTPMEGGLT